MTAAQLAGLFQPFNRLGRERSAQQGTGIGLVISRRLAELMGGTLRARSVAGEGSSFILTLPRVVDPDTVRSDLDTLYTTSTGYRTPHRPLRRGQRDQRRGDARHPRRSGRRSSSTSRSPGSTRWRRSAGAGPT